jgi:glutaconyl-CoA/methylmalonyl-CoA decarboxylase subunit gamma
VLRRSGGGSTRLTVVRDGKPATIEVAPDLSTVRVGDGTFPVTVVARSSGRVELEIGGERVVVDGWPESEPTPTHPVTVDGEAWTIAVEVDRASGSPSVPAAPAARGGAGGPPPPAVADGVPVIPPMPGRVVELRVREGEAVSKGAVLLILEAMKMRTEVTSPVEGTVRGLRVGPGTNARAKEPMLFVAPG